MKTQFFYYPRPPLCQNYYSIFVYWPILFSKSFAIFFTLRPSTYDIMDNLCPCLRNNPIWINSYTQWHISPWGYEQKSIILSRIPNSRIPVNNSSDFNLLNIRMIKFQALIYHCPYELIWTDMLCNLCVRARNTFSWNGPIRIIGIKGRRR